MGSRDCDSATSLGSQCLFQRLTTFTMRKFFLIPNLSMPRHISRSFPLRRRPTPILLQPPFSWKTEPPFFFQPKHPQLPQSLFRKQDWPQSSGLGNISGVCSQLDVTPFSPPLSGLVSQPVFYPVKSAPIQAMSSWFLEENAVEAVFHTILLDCFFSAAFLHFRGHLVSWNSSWEKGLVRLHPFACRVFHLFLHPGGRSITDSHQNICLVGLPLIFNHKHTTFLSLASSSRQSKHSDTSPSLPISSEEFIAIHCTLQAGNIPPYLCDGNCAMVFQLPNGFQLLLLVVPALCTGASGLWAIDPPYLSAGRTPNSSMIILRCLHSV